MDDFDAVFAKHCTPDEHGRDTPEKELQSALLRDAYAHGRRMEMLGSATRRTKHVVTPIFVADELALPTDEGGRILCDLFCVREAEDGLLCPMVIELKAERAKKRLIAQVDGFARLVEEQLAGFEALTNALLGGSKTMRNAGSFGLGPWMPQTGRRKISPSAASV